MTPNDDPDPGIHQHGEMPPPPNEPEGRGPDDHDCDKGGHCYVAEEKLMAEIFNGSFSVRIPASIEKAEGLLNGEHECERIGFYITNVGVNTVVFTANQLALAKAAAGLACAYTWDVNGTQRIDDCGDCERCASLIEFCETVESL